MKKAFTIIEILIVVGIISILAVALLVLVNPAEAQRRTRDTKRLKDVQFIESVVKQYLDDGGTGFADNSVCTTTNMCYSRYNAAIGTDDTVPCGAANYNWIGEANLDLCNYARAIPVDPSNIDNATCVDDSETNDISTSCYLYYAVVVNGTNYEIGARQESTANIDNVTGDGGNSDTWYEVYTQGSNDLIDDEIYDGGSPI